MADAINPNVSPISRKRHQARARFARLNHSKQTLSFLSVHATRLGTTVAAVFGALDSHTAEQVRKAANKNALGL